jgi:hypothetical protein
MDLLQLIGININALIENPILATLILGAAEGIVVGLITGALVWSLTKAPDVLGRALLLAVIFGLLGFIWEFARLSVVLEYNLGGLIRAFSDNPAVGPLLLRALVRTFFYMLLGAAIGIGSRVPQFMIRGVIVGIFLGGVVGAIIWFVTQYYFGFTLQIAVFRLFVVIGVWGMITLVARP